MRNPRDGDRPLDGRPPRTCFVPVGQHNPPLLLSARSQNLPGHKSQMQHAQGLIRKHHPTESD
jgi:hypothetical protein